MDSDFPLILHGCWRSGTSYRTRNTLNIQGLEYQRVADDRCLGDERQSTRYLELNGRGLVPSPVHDGLPLKQNSVILE